MKWDAKFSVTEPEYLREFCTRKNWFTSGSCEQYRKMFDMNRDKKPLEEIALVIWLCSCDVTREEVQKELEELKEDYLMELGEMQQAEGERFADEAYCAQFE